MLCGSSNNLSKLNATIYYHIHEAITSQKTLPISLYRNKKNPVLYLPSLSNKFGRKSMASSSSNAMLGDVYVDELISSYGGVQDFTKPAGVYFKERSHKGLMRGSVSLRRPHQLLYGPLNFGRSNFYSSWSIQNSGLVHGPWQKNFSASSSACCLARAEHDVSLDSSLPDEQPGNSSTWPNLYVIIVLSILISALNYS